MEVLTLYAIKGFMARCLGIVITDPISFHLNDK